MTPQTVSGERHGDPSHSLFLSALLGALAVGMLFLTGGWAWPSELLNMCQSPGGERHNVIIPVKQYPCNTNTTHMCTGSLPGLMLIYCGELCYFKCCILQT